MVMKVVHNHPVNSGIAWASLLLALVAFALMRDTGPALARSAHPTGAGLPALVNGNFECTQGFHSQTGIDGNVPAGWTAVLLNGYPRINSTNLEYDHNCGEDYGNEKIEGWDSWVLLSQDNETPPEPGKPFDAVLFQQVDVTQGVAYSLSGWMVSLCGGSTMPNDCPSGYYMAKMLGIDPTGGTDPLAASVLWVEDRRNFTESRWANLRLGTTARSDKLTVFARIRSPFRWHGNYAFLDACSLVRAPTAAFEGLPATVPGRQVTVRWNGAQSPDIATIPGGTYRLLFDMQYRPAGDAAWTDWQTGQPAGEAVFTAPATCGVRAYEFRLRARSEQPPAPPEGAWPNHRYPGDWSAPASVQFVMPACPPRAYLPLLSK
jgi:hypothetical protein